MEATSSFDHNQKLISDSSKANVPTGTRKRRAGRKKFQETRHPIFKGVRRRNGKWVCELRHPHNNKHRIWLGTFSCPDMAARAHDVAALALRGDSASLNFPESAHLLPQARSTSIRDIQCAALAAAKSIAMRDEVEIKSSPSSCSSPSAAEDMEKAGEGSRSLFLDEEELFNMPALIDSMAEGLILTPPAMKTGFSWNDVEVTMDLTLWSN